MEKIEVLLDPNKPRSSKQVTLILQQTDLSLTAQRHGEMNLRELSVDMITIYDFPHEILEAYKKAANVLYIAPSGQIKILKSRHKVLH